MDFLDNNNIIASLITFAGCIFLVLSVYIFTIYYRQYLFNKNFKNIILLIENILYDDDITHDDIDDFLEFIKIIREFVTDGDLKRNKILNQKYQYTYELENKINKRALQL